MANPIARRLRKTLTPQEVKVWNHLRSWRKQGFHFRRQAPRRGYIVDFVCLKHRLIIEIDGGQHNVDPHRASDQARDRELSRAGFHVFRFWNSEVDQNLQGVLETIHTVLIERSPHPAVFAVNPSPERGGGLRVSEANTEGEGREVGGEPLVSLDQFVPKLPLARSPIFDELRSLQFPRIGVHAREPPTRAGVSSRSKHSPRRSQSCMCREMRRGFDGSGCRAR